jgi:chromosome segregation ATPase
MEKEPDQPMATETDDLEIRMRQSLGFERKPSSAPIDDPLASARQAIRSQSTARDYVERQLARAEAELDDLRTKLRSARQEQGLALTTARNAIAANSKLEATLASTEAELRAERSKREHSERSWREALATVHDLRGMLESAGQTLRAVKANLADERHARQVAEEGVKPAGVRSTGLSSQPAEEPGKQGPAIQNLASGAPATIKPPRKTKRNGPFREDQEPVQWRLAAR